MRNCGTFCQTRLNSANVPHFHDKKCRNPWIAVPYKTAHYGAAIKVWRTRWEKSGAHGGAFLRAAMARLLHSF